MSRYRCRALKVAGWVFSLRDPGFCSKQAGTDAAVDDAADAADADADRSLWEGGGAADSFR